MKLSYKFKLYSSRKNRHMHRSIDLPGEIYNHCIALHRRYYRMSRRHLNVFTLKKHITRPKRLKKYDHWNQPGSQAVQDIVLGIERNCTIFFNSLTSSRRVKVSPPGFKKRRKYKSFTLAQAGYKLLEGSKIKIGSRIFKYHKSRDMQGIIKTLTVKRDTLGDSCLIFSCDPVPMPVNERAMTGKSAGSDFGIQQYLTRSDGEVTDSPEFFKNGIRPVRNASKALSRKKWGPVTEAAPGSILRGCTGRSPTRGLISA